jgi:DNA-binding IclR family transcriptional regulator
VTDTERYHVPNLERALTIMEYLADHPQPQGITDLAEALSFPKNSVFRIVSTLHAHGYLKRDDGSKRFVLGTKLLTLGYAAVQEGNLVEKSLDIMHLIRDQTDESTFLGILDGIEGVVLEQVASNQQVKVALTIGTRFPLHTAAPAKAMMAHLGDDALDDLFDRITYTPFTETTHTSAASLKAEIIASRQAGYAIDNGEHNEGIRCVAAAILNQRREPVAGIWIIGPAFRLKAEDFERLGPIVAAGALRISERFGYIPQGQPRQSAATSAVQMLNDK